MIALAVLHLAALQLPHATTRCGRIPISTFTPNERCARAPAQTNPHADPTVLCGHAPHMRLPARRATVTEYLHAQSLLPKPGTTSSHALFSTSRIATRTRTRCGNIPLVTLEVPTATEHVLGTPAEEVVAEATETPTPVPLVTAT